MEESVNIAPSENSLAIKVGQLFSPVEECAKSIEASKQNKVEENHGLSKMCLVSPSHDEFDALVQMLKEQLEDGNGETIFEVGVGGRTESEVPGLEADDLEAAVATLQTICDTISATCVFLRTKMHSGDLRSSEFLVRFKTEAQDFLEVRVAVVGNVDAGKSTLLGVLTHGELDNGRGHARMKLFNHKHEMETGRTSSIGNDILGFDGTGNVVNKPDHGHLDWTKICEQSAKVVTFIDLAGHEKYLKTTVSGMTGHVPDFCMLMVGANAGIIGMTKEHLGLALALSVPVFVVVTKVDMCPANVLQDTLKLLQRVLKSPGCRKIPILVLNRDDAVMTATNFTSQRICPIFQVSNVTGENLDLLRLFLNLLNPRVDPDVDEPAEFQIDDTFSVPGVGTVVSGTCLKGLIQLNDTLMLGPDPLGVFMPVPIKSIHRKRLPVREVRGGQTASFAIKKIKRSALRKGMVLVSPRIHPQACWEFEGEILVLHHPTTISVRYQAMVHVGSIRQTASILFMSEEHLRTGDKALCRFRFIKNPEYLRINMKMVFREGRTKAVGTVVKLFPHITGAAQTSTRAQRAAKKAADLKGGGQGSSRSGHYHEPQKSSKRGRRGGKSSAKSVAAEAVQANSMPEATNAAAGELAAAEQTSPRQS